VLSAVALDSLGRAKRSKTAVGFNPVTADVNQIQTTMAPSGITSGRS
jgi:hypothetical protein